MLRLPLAHISCPDPCCLSWSWVLPPEASVAVYLWETEGLPLPPALPQQSLQALPGVRCPPLHTQFLPSFGNAPSCLWIRRTRRSLQRGFLGPCLGSLLFLVLSCSPLFSSPGPRPQLRTGECLGQRPLDRALREELVKAQQPRRAQAAHPVALGHSPGAPNPVLGAAIPGTGRK